MARIAGIELENNWKVNFALTRIRGIGWSLARKLLKEIGMKEEKRISDLSGSELGALSSKLEEFSLEGDLVRKVSGDLQRLKLISSYRGLRHSHSLPSRGQRTRSNARTKRGKRKTVGAFKKEMLTKKTESETKKG